VCVGSLCQIVWDWVCFVVKVLYFISVLFICQKQEEKTDVLRLFSKIIGRIRYNILKMSRVKHVLKIQYQHYSTHRTYYRKYVVGMLREHWSNSVKVKRQR